MVVWEVHWEPASGSQVDSGQTFWRSALKQLCEISREGTDTCNLDIQWTSFQGCDRVLKSVPNLQFTVRRQDEPNAEQQYTFHYCMVLQDYVLYRRLVNLDCKSSECVFGSENTETSSGRRLWLKYWTDGLPRLRKYKVQRALKPSLEAQPRITAFHQIPQMAWTSFIVAIIYFSFDICGPWIIFGT